MRCKCRILSFNTPASDGSIIPQEIMQRFLESSACKEALEKHTMIGGLTHRTRSLAANFPETAATLSKTVGKDDSMLIVSDKAPAPTHYVDSLWIDGGYLWGTVTILEEDGLDDIAIQNIRRLKGMLKNGIKCPLSCIIVGYWNSSTNSGDLLVTLKAFRGIDFTGNPSWACAGVEEIYDDEPKEERKFSEIQYKEENILKVKTFSDIKSFSLGDIPKTSKINGCFTKLKAKEFSTFGTVTECDVIIPTQKEFTMAQVKERLRESKLGPRMYLRRLYISYKQLIKSMGGVENISEGDLKILKSLFTSDVLNVLNSVTPEVIQGKQINTLLGLSSLSKTARVEGQKLQMPFRQAHIEFKKQGFLSKMRSAKLQEAYSGFINGLISDVFGNNPEPIPEEEPEEIK